MTILAENFRAHYTDGTLCWCLPIIESVPGYGILFLHRPEDRSEIEP